MECSWYCCKQVRQGAPLAWHCCIHCVPWMWMMFVTPPCRLRLLCDEAEAHLILAVMLQLLRLPNQEPYQKTKLAHAPCPDPFPTGINQAEMPRSDRATHKHAYTRKSYPDLHIVIHIHMQNVTHYRVKTVEYLPAYGTSLYHVSRTIGFDSKAGSPIFELLLYREA